MRTNSSRAIAIFASSLLLLMFRVSALAGGGEFTGQFETTLVANTEELERVILKPTTADRWKDAGTFSEGTHMTSAMIWDPVHERTSVYALLVEDEEEDRFGGGHDRRGLAAGSEILEQAEAAATAPTRSSSPPEGTEAPPPAGGASARSRRAHFGSNSLFALRSQPPLTFAPPPPPATWGV